MGIIYRATYIKSYIGQSKRSFQIRKREHKIACKENGLTDRFHNALRELGWDNFTWEILETCDDNLLHEREAHYISMYNSHYDGYNSTTGGGRDYTVSDETKKKVGIKSAKKMGKSGLQEYDDQS
jgi:group I intron endonuclease